MIGKHHVIVSLFARTALRQAARVILTESVSVLYLERAAEYFYHDSELFVQGNMYAFLHMGLYTMFFILGTLFPDIDSKQSILGRYLYLPVEHRTWTHCWLPVVLLLYFAQTRIWLRYFTLGYILHLAEDAFSYKGIDFFYPITPKRKRNGLYRTGHVSEQIFVCVLIGLSLALTLYLRRDLFRGLGLLLGNYSGPVGGL